MSGDYQMICDLRRRLDFMRVVKNSEILKKKKRGMFIKLAVRGRNNESHVAELERRYMIGHIPGWADGRS